MEDTEIAAMAKIAEALGAIQDENVRSRVLAWANARYATGEPVALAPSMPAGVAPQPRTGEVAEVKDREIPGIARLTESGELKVTARDLKARSGLDAVQRLAHIAIWAHEKLTGETAFSSGKGLVPILKAYRVYDPNARRRLRELRGLVRDGGDLTLDTHAKEQAEQYVKEILDGSVQGQWNPAARSVRRVKKAPEKKSKTSS